MSEDSAICRKSTSYKIKAAKSVGGYSLIELLTVIAIIGILATIAIPTYHSYRDKARMSTIYAALRHMKFSQELYFTDNSRYFPESDGDIIVDATDGGGRYLVPNSDIELYIPNQQLWIITSIKNTAEDDNTEIIDNSYTVLIETNMDRNQDGNKDQYEYFKKADAGGVTIEESDFFPLTPIALD